MTTPMCDLSVKKTRRARARPLASRNSFRERCQGAPSGCAVLFFEREYAPDCSEVKASLSDNPILDAERNPIQLGRAADLSHDREEIDFDGMSGSPFFASLSLIAGVPALGLQQSVCR